MNPNEHPEPGQDTPPEREEERRFHPWRLLGGIMGVMIVLAIVAAAVDIIVLGF